MERMSLTAKTTSVRSTFKLYFQILSIEGLEADEKDLVEVSVVFSRNRNRFVSNSTSLRWNENCGPPKTLVTNLHKQKRNLLQTSSNEESSSSAMSINSVNVYGEGKYKMKEIKVKVAVKRLNQRPLILQSSFGIMGELSKQIRLPLYLKCGILARLRINQNDRQQVALCFLNFFLDVKKFEEQPPSGLYYQHQHPSLSHVQDMEEQYRVQMESNNPIPQLEPKDGKPIHINNHSEFNSNFKKRMDHSGCLSAICVTKEVADEQSRNVHNSYPPLDEQQQRDKKSLLIKYFFDNMNRCGMDINIIRPFSFVSKKNSDEKNNIMEVQDNFKDYPMEIYTSDDSVSVGDLTMMSSDFPTLLVAASNIEQKSSSFLPTPGEEDISCNKPSFYSSSKDEDPSIEYYDETVNDDINSLSTKEKDGQQVLKIDSSSFGEATLRSIEHAKKTLKRHGLYNESSSSSSSSSIKSGNYSSAQHNVSKETSSSSASPVTTMYSEDYSNIYHDGVKNDTSFIAKFFLCQDPMSTDEEASTDEFSNKFTNSSFSLNKNSTKSVSSHSFRILKDNNNNTSTNSISRCKYKNGPEESTNTITLFEQRTFFSSPTTTANNPIFKISSQRSQKSRASVEHDDTQIL